MTSHFQVTATLRQLSASNEHKVTLNTTRSRKTCTQVTKRSQVPNVTPFHSLTGHFSLEHLQGASIKSLVEKEASLQEWHFENYIFEKITTTGTVNDWKWPWTLEGQWYMHVLQELPSPKFQSITLYNHSFSGYQQCWDKCTEWPQNDLEHYESKVSYTNVHIYVCY